MVNISSIPNIPLKELRKKESMSRRAYNACKISRLYTLHDIVSHYRLNKDFTTIQNTGVKTNEELITICEKYIANYAYA